MHTIINTGLLKYCHMSTGCKINHSSAVSDFQYEIFITLTACFLTLKDTF